MRNICLLLKLPSLQCFCYGSTNGIGCMTSIKPGFSQSWSCFLNFHLKSGVSSDPFLLIFLPKFTLVTEKLDVTFKFQLPALTAPQHQHLHWSVQYEPAFRTQPWPSLWPPMGVTQYPWTLPKALLAAWTPNIPANTIVYTEFWEMLSWLSL